ncbi:RimK family alpha-L-glutamate ligase [Brevibacterium sp. XM4083]|uniref:ATP-grasp domain-containing protein n=1 Tax=Brevibacterium sp. XM4083 TaxID=2583238 RepID=UPI00112816D8|nr:RimK family alpha-L-glutamate ligase [Brevibacterium sp. XM4083]MCM1011812.1 RimK family alpha-L-glutamate ligase [Brevibacterium sp. XM4083]
MTKSIAILSDRVGWEERQIVDRAAAMGMRTEWINDASLPIDQHGIRALEPFDVALVRSKSYVRGGLIAASGSTGNTRMLNTASAIQICENKLITRQTLSRAGIPVPEYRLVFSRESFREAVEAMRFPVVMKPIYGGLGKRVTLLTDKRTAESVFDYVADLGHGFEQACLLEEYMSENSWRVLVVGTRIVAAAEFQPAPGDWRSNAALGSGHNELELTPKVQQVIRGVVDQIGPGIYGIDIFRRGDGGVVNEINHAPGFRGVTEGSGVDVSDEICRYIEGMDL